jgi:23S rRNA pseudouridine2604 synthase
VEAVRLNKYLSETGYCSRREADRLIQEGRILVNGAAPELGCKVTISDQIMIDGKKLAAPTKAPVYLAFHKPVGIECTTNQKVKNNVVDYINYPERIFPIGRLDKASEGLLLLTNDGDIVNKILRARNQHEKEYLVTVDLPINPRFVQRMSTGIPILGTVTRPCVVESIGNKAFRIILTQGMNRQIRRMCEHLGYQVQSLKRVRIMSITLDVAPGQYRLLTDAEINRLQDLLQDSDKVAPEPNKPLSTNQIINKTVKNGYQRRQR